MVSTNEQTPREAPPADARSTDAKQERTALNRKVMQRPLPPAMLDRGGCPFDPPKLAREHHARGPLTRMTLLNGADVWLVTSFEEARRILGDPRFSADKFRNPDALATGQTRGCPMASPPPRHGIFIMMDPPEHSRFRRMLTGAFTVRRMQALEERVRTLAGELLEAMRARGSAGDLVKEYALPLPSLVICELLGVPYSERAEFQDRTALLLKLDMPVEDKDAVMAGMRAFMQSLVHRKRAQLGDDLLSDLMRIEGETALNDDELVDVAIVLLIAGHETTANMLALGTFALLENPAQLEALRTHPEHMETAVEELLRFLSIVHTGPTRIALEDVDVGGVRVAKGETVLLSLPQVNRDEHQWPHPDDLDVTRPRAAHMAFGHGVHQCLGQQLARVEMRVGLSELLARLPNLRLAVPPEAVRLRTDMSVFGVHALPIAWG